MKKSRSGNCDVLMQFSVMILLIYELLIMSLIMLNHVVSGLVKTRCLCQFANSPLCMNAQWNSTRIALEIHLKFCFEPSANGKM